MREGTIVQVIGPCVDIRFEDHEVPSLFNAVKIEDNDRKIDLTLEVAQQIGNNTVRCIALASTDGLARGMKAFDTEKPISVPVGPQTLGRIFNLLGKPLDGKGPVTDPGMQRQIHQPSPNFEEQLPLSTSLETGIKVIDLLAPYPKGGKIGLLGGAGVGKTGFYYGVDPQYRYRTRRGRGLRRRRRAHSRRK
jgi:F-type H+/Na+-transporting ATPase subunit beta